MSIAFSASVAGGLFEANSVSTITNVTTRGFLRRRAAQSLDAKGTLELRARMTALDGVVPGSTALKNYTRVDSSSELGGVRGIETQVLINRATTNADVTEIEATVNSLSSKTTFGASPPANLDGNPLGTR
jgi:hypothetical protein